MPSVSGKQHRFMAAVANNSKFAKKAGVPQSVGEEFVQADKGRKFGSGGARTRPDAQKLNRPDTNQGKAEFFSKGGDMKKMAMGGSAGNGITKAKMGAVRTAAPSKDGVAAKGKTKGTMVKMSGSKPLGMKRGGKAC